LPNQFVEKRSFQEATGKATLKNKIPWFPRQTILEEPGAFLTKPKKLAGKILSGIKGKRNSKNIPRFKADNL
jgi:hypothetical protein